MGARICMHSVAELFHRWSESEEGLFGINEGIIHRCENSHSFLWHQRPPLLLLRPEPPLPFLLPADAAVGLKKILLHHSNILY